ncbi:hypothetical protein NC652_020062 [Populus alba x Populus x berolinensis]|nr:hypothetical protein NC652_020062 [Populus alba x Populus x berolinensis]
MSFVVCLDVIKTSCRACQDIAHRLDALLTCLSGGRDPRSLAVAASSCIIYSELQRIRIGELPSDSCARRLISQER